MDDSEQRVDNVNEQVGVLNSDSRYAWGARAIGEEIERTPRQALHLLSQGQIKCALRKGGRAGGAGF